MAREGDHHDIQAKAHVAGLGKLSFITRFVNIKKFLLAVFLGVISHSEVEAQFTCADFDGAYVLGQDASNTYLGFFGSEFAFESIMNPFGPYGSEFRSDSVRNEFGQFGSPFNTFSANNSFASFPPVILRRGDFIAYLTTNPLRRPGVSLADIDASCNFFSAFPDLPQVTVYTLSVSKTGTGSGTVTSSPSGINCGSTCSASYADGTNVTLTATPASGSTFAGWDVCTGTGTCTVSMTVSGSVTATFNTTTTGAVEVSPAFSGLWYNPDQDGHGFSISVHSSTSASVYWYTFNPFGDDVWIFGAGDIIGNRIESTAFVLQGMEFGTWDPSNRQVFDWGSFVIEFHSCDSATLTYNSTLSYESGEEFGSGTIPLVRLASIDGLECDDAGSTGPVATTTATPSYLSPE